MSAHLNAAFAYIKRRWFIFPLAPGAKVPLAGTRGLLDATIDEAQIRAWWTEYPDANIGVNCGMSGLVVLDVDTKRGKVGGNSLISLIGDDFSLIETVHAHTWSGGSHYFYRGECKSSASQLAPDLDIKGEGGYVVLAPSRICEKGITGWYKWDTSSGEKLPIKEFPDLFRPPEQERVPVRAVVTVTERQRNHEMHRRASAYRGQLGMSPSAIEAALRVDNQERCNPPLDHQEIAKIAKSAGQYTPNEKPAAPSLALPNGGEVMNDDDFLENVELEVNWQIEGFVQKSGMILLTALPKVGKSDLARNMARAVATGGDFLGRRTKRARVLWIGLAEPAQKLRSAQETMNLLGLGILWVTTRPPGQWQPWLAEVVEKHRPGFVVVDEIGRLAADLENINDYSQVIRATQPFLDLRSKYGTTFTLLHHDRKMGGTLGSTAWDGAVDCIMSLTRTQDNVRTIQTKQRMGEDLEPTVLARDSNTGLISAPMSKALADQRKVEQRILDALSPGRQLTRQDLANIASRGSYVGRCAVDALLSAGLIEAIGTGLKGDPRFYQQRERGGGPLLPLGTRSNGEPPHNASGTYIYKGVPEAPEATEANDPKHTRSIPEAPDENPSHPNIPEVPEANLKDSLTHDEFRLRAYGETQADGQR